MGVEKRLSLLTSLGRSGASPDQSYDALDVHLTKPADELEPDYARPSAFAKAMADKTSRQASSGSTELAEVLPAPFRARVFQRTFFRLDLRQTGSVLKLEDLISQQRGSFILEISSS